MRKYADFSDKMCVCKFQNMAFQSLRRVSVPVVCPYKKAQLTPGKRATAVCVRRLVQAATHQAKPGRFLHSTCAASCQPACRDRSIRYSGCQLAGNPKKLRTSWQLVGNQFETRVDNLGWQLVSNQFAQWVAALFATSTLCDAPQLRNDLRYQHNL